MRRPSTSVGGEAPAVLGRRSRRPRARARACRTGTRRRCPSHRRAVRVEQLVEIGDAHAAVDRVVAVGQALDLGVFLVVLVDDLADQLLEAVLERDQPGDRAVLVGDEREVELLGLHLAHQPVDRLVLGDEPCRTDELGDRVVALARRARRASGPWCRRGRRRRRRRRCPAPAGG